MRHNTFIIFSLTWKANVLNQKENACTESSWTNITIITSIKNNRQTLLIWALIHLYNSYKNSWEGKVILLLHSLILLPVDWHVTRSHETQRVTGSVHTQNTNQTVVHKSKNLLCFPSGWAILYIKKIFRLLSKYTLIILKKKNNNIKTVLQNKSQ